MNVDALSVLYYVDLGHFCYLFCQLIILLLLLSKAYRGTSLLRKTKGYPEPSTPNLHDPREANYILMN